MTAPDVVEEDTPRTGGAKRGVVQIVLGTVLGQGLVVLISPILSRLYGPADFAVLQVFTGVVSVMAVLVTLRLELAIPLAKDGKEARSVFAAGLVATVLGSLVLGVAGWLTAPLWAQGETLGALRNVFWVVPPTGAAIAAFQLVSAQLIRAERYRDLAVRNATQGVGTAAAQLGFGLLGLQHLGLLLGTGLGRLSGLASMRLRKRTEPVEKLQPADLTAAVSRFRRFPLVTTWSALLNNLSRYAAFPLFAVTFGVLATGSLAFTTRLLALPVTVIGQAVAQVYLGRGAVAQRTNPKDLPRLTWYATGRLALLGIVPTLVVILAGPWLFGVIFGQAWVRAGDYARILALAFLAQFVTTPATHVFNLVERQGLALIADSVRLVLVVGAPLLVWQLGGSDLAGVTAYAAAVLVSYLGVLALVWWALRDA
jgi:O-antigen/teichoic acid export membrane protein